MFRNNLKKFQHETFKTCQINAASQYGMYIAQYFMQYYCYTVLTTQYIKLDG